MKQDMGVAVPARATAVEPVPVSPLRDGIANASDNPVVGHKTLRDGSHVPLYKDEAERWWAEAVSEREKRAADMPDESAAIRQLWDAGQRLKELGWQDPIYAPKDGSALDLIEVGSTGIHRGFYEGSWPTGSWWIDDGDHWPSRPAFARPAQGIEARQGGDGTAPSGTDESPVGSADAPETIPMAADRG